jgi:hypothetical protein
MEVQEDKIFILQILSISVHQKPESRSGVTIKPELNSQNWTRGSGSDTKDTNKITTTKFVTVRQGKVKKEGYIRKLQVMQSQNEETNQISESLVTFFWVKNT